MALDSNLDTVAFAVFDGRSWHDVWPLPVPLSVHAARIMLRWRDGVTRQDVVTLTPLPWRRHDE